MISDFPPRQLGAGKKGLGAELAPLRYARGSCRVGDWLQTHRIESAGPDWPEGDAADASMARECKSAAATLLLTSQLGSDSISFERTRVFPTLLLLPESTALPSLEQCR